MKLSEIKINKNIVYALLILLGIIIIFLLSRGGKDDNRSYENLVSARDSARNALLLVDNLEKKVQDLNQKDTISMRKIDSLTDKLIKKNGEIVNNSIKYYDLRNKLAKSKDRKDTAAIINDCDSIVALHEASEKYWYEYKNYSTELLDTYSNTLDIKDSIITVKNMQINTLKTTVQYMEDKINSSLKDVKRRNQVYLGAELLGNRQLLVAGGGINLSLLNKRGQMFEVKAISVNNSMYYGMGAKFRLSFRK